MFIVSETKRSAFETIGRLSAWGFLIISIATLSVAVYRQFFEKRGPDTVRVVVESQTETGTTLIPLEQAIQALASIENNNAAALYTELMKANCLLEKGKFVPAKTDEQGRVIEAPACEKK